MGWKIVRGIAKAKIRGEAKRTREAAEDGEKNEVRLAHP